MDTVSGGLTYAYSVTSVDATGLCESAASACAEGQTTGPCTEPPAFAGIGSVTNAQSATCQLDLAWAAASPYCGASVTYSIYRSTTSGFPPGPANRIAVGVTGVAYGDSSGLQSGTRYYYVVRAVDATNGAEDQNTIEASGVPTGFAEITSGAGPGRVFGPHVRGFNYDGAYPGGGGTASLLPMTL